MLKELIIEKIIEEESKKDPKKGFKPFPSEKLGDAPLREVDKQDAHVQEFEKAQSFLKKDSTLNKMQKASGISLNMSQKREVKSILKDPRKIEKSIQKTEAAVEGGKKPGLADAFTGAIMKSMPLLIGSALGGFDVGVSAQEGANAAVASEQAGALAEREQSRKEQMTESQVGLTEEQRNKEHMSNVERQASAIGATKLEEEKLQLDKRKLDIEDQMNQFKTLQAVAGQNPSVAQKLSSLSNEQQKNIGNLTDAKRAVVDLQNAINQGVNKFSAVGDNEYTQSRTRFIEAIARMKSGAAISDKEFDIYSGMTPSTTDQKRIVTKKINDAINMVDDRFVIAGFDPQEFMGHISRGNQEAQASQQLPTLEQIRAAKAKRGL